MDATISVAWADMKNFLDNRDLSAQWLSVNNSYYIYAFDGPFSLFCLIPQDGSDAADQTDFESNYKSEGNQALDPEYKGSYNLPVTVNPSTLTSGTYYWFMMNNSMGNRMFIQKIVLTTTYGGLSSSVTSSNFAFQRFSSGIPTGGNTLSVIPSNTTFPTSNLSEAMESDSGLSVSGLSIEGPLLSFSIVSQYATSTTMNLLFPLEHEFTLICLNPGEGIILSSTSVIQPGASINGFIEWVERV